MKTDRCEKMRADGTVCGRRAVARIVPAIDDPAETEGWLACARHADAAADSMRAQHTPDMLARVRRI